MSRRRKPYDPAARERALAERRLSEENAALAERGGASVKRDRGGRVTSIYRSNVFTRLREAKTINAGQYDAAQRLCELWAQWKGLEGRLGRADVVDGGTGCAELITDRMIAGRAKVNAVLGAVGPLDRALLEAFMTATVEEDRPMEWRGIVERVASITGRDAQSTAVVMALENLRLAFEQPRKRAA